MPAYRRGLWLSHLEADWTEAGINSGPKLALRFVSDRMSGFRSVAMIAYYTCSSVLPRRCRNYHRRKLRTEQGHGGIYPNNFIGGEQCPDNWPTGDYTLPGVEFFSKRVRILPEYVTSRKKELIFFKEGGSSQILHVKFQKFSGVDTPAPRGLTHPTRPPRCADAVTQCLPI